MATYLPNNGKIAFQIEDQPATSFWKLESKHSGYTGKGYYKWTGKNDFTAPTASEPTQLKYTFKTDASGDYFLSIRALRHTEGRKVVEAHKGLDGPDAVARDQENDVFVRVDNGPWLKVFFGGSFDSWTWARTFDINHTLSPAKYKLSAGTHTIEIAGRSAAVMIDKLHLSLGAANLDNNTPMSSISGSVETPPPPAPPPADIDGALKISIIDTKTDKVIATIANGSSIDAGLLANKSLTISADVIKGGALDGKVGSMALNFQNGQVKVIENVAPYALFGDKNGDFFGNLELGAGSYNVNFGVFSGKSASGTKLGDVKVGFTVNSSSSTTPPPPPPSSTPEIVVSIVDTTTDKVVTTIKNGGVIDAALLANKSLTISADVIKGGALDGKVGSMALSFQNGQVKQLENVAPYALFGDKNGDFFGDLKLGAGLYKIEFDVFSGPKGGGVKLRDIDIAFSVAAGGASSGGSPATVPSIGRQDEDVIVFLTDVKTGQKVLQVGDDGRISRTELADKKLGFLVETKSGGAVDGKVKSMKLDFEDGEVVLIDNAAPFTMFDTGRFFGRGYYDLDIYSYDGENGTGKLLDVFKLDFEVF